MREVNISDGCDNVVGGDANCVLVVDLVGKGERGYVHEGAMVGGHL